MIQEAKNIFIVGVKGVAMANLAIILSQMGKNVVGSDVAEEFITDENLHKANIIIQDISDPLPSDIDMIIYSGAHGGMENKQIQQAKEKNITVVHQEDILAEIMDQHEIRIAVCGSHGKTTTSAMLAFCLKKLGANPTYMVGTSTFNDMSGGAFGDGKYCVMEADEYAIDPPRDKTPKFLKLNPTHIICTNIDYDHPDVYENLDEVKKVFIKFFQKNNSPIYIPDSELKKLTTEMSQENFKTFSANGELTLSVPGDKNRLNATGAFSLLSDLGFDKDKVTDVLKEFGGAKRRFEVVYEEKNITIIDDYAHHPEEIEATIGAAREKFKNRMVSVIFQPHTYSRTAALQNEFVEALSIADNAFIAPIFGSARENGTTRTITSEDLEHIAREKGIENVTSYETNEELMTLLSEKLQTGDVIFTMGAGDIYKVKNDIIKLIKTI